MCLRTLPGAGRVVGPERHGSSLHNPQHLKKTSKFIKVTLHGSSKWSLCGPALLCKVKTVSLEKPMYKATVPSLSLVTLGRR